MYVSRPQIAPSPSRMSLEPSPLQDTATLQRTPIELPTGGCRFIVAVTTKGDQRCPCQGFTSSRQLRGTTCECGHHAWVHVQKSMVEDAVPFAVHAALLSKVQRLEDRLQRLQDMHEADRQAFEDMLVKERRDRERDSRVLREGMRELLDELEGRLDHKLTEAEDRVDSVADRQARIEGRIGVVDEAEISLESRVINLEDRLADGSLLKEVHDVSSVASPNSPCSDDSHASESSSSQFATFSSETGSKFGSRDLAGCRSLLTDNQVNQPVELTLRPWHSTTDVLNEESPSIARKRPGSSVPLSHGMMKSASSETPRSPNDIQPTTFSLVSSLVRMSVPSSSTSFDVNESQSAVIADAVSPSTTPACKRRKRNLKQSTQTRAMGMVE